ncbi:MAG: LptF/LptG family permease [Bacteroidales bacterium]
MKQAHRLVLSSFTGPFALTFFMVMFVLILQFLWLYIDDLVGKGLSWLVIAELIFYASGNLLTMALPLATLLSSIMAMGNLGEHNELIALKAAGISLARIMRPLFMLAVCITIIDFIFSNNLLPYFNLKVTSLLYDVRQQRPELQIKEGVFYDGINNYIIRVENKNEETGALLGIMIYDHSKGNGNRAVTTADSGYLRVTENQQYLIFSLYDGCSYEELTEATGEKKYPFQTNKFKVQEAVFELSGYGFERSDETLFKSGSQMLNLQQLSMLSDSLGKECSIQAHSQAGNFLRSSSFLNAREFYSIAESVTKNVSIDAMLQASNSKQRLFVTERALELAKQAQTNFISYVDNLRYTKRKVNLHNIEWHLKLAYPLSCLIFFFIGAPLGAIIRKGGFGTPFLISLLIFLLYYVVSMSFKRLAKNGAWEPYIAIWMSSFITIPLGIFFTYKAATEQQLRLPKWYLTLVYRVGKIFANK